MGGQKKVGKVSRHMPVRPAVLLLEQNDERRHFLGKQLAARGYEVVPASNVEEARRFAEGLGPSLIVGPVALTAEDAGILDHARDAQTRRHQIERTLLVLAEAGDTTFDDDDEEENTGQVRILSDDVRFLPVAGLSNAEIAHRILLVLIGREIGLEPDLDLRSLVGELALTPVLELVRSLNEVRLTGRLDLVDGTIYFQDGTVVTATSTAAGRPTVRGAKAFCRLARHMHGPCHISFCVVKETADIFEKLPDLILRALEESHLEMPPFNTRLCPVAGERAPSGEISYSSRDLLLAMVGRCETVGELLDGLPATDGRLIQAINKLVSTGFLRLERPRADVTVITDSTSDLPPNLAQEHGIDVVPLSVIFGEEALRDGIDVHARDFYQMLKTVPDHPRTEPPGEAEFFEHYRLALAEHDVVSVHISEKLSQTPVNARAAAERGLREITDLPEERREFVLKVVDSENVSMGVGLLALFAARMAYRGENAASIVRHLGKMRRRIHTLFVVNTLDFLVRGGRIGKARAIVGKLLGIKPILGVVDGEVAPVDKVRGGRAAHPRIIKLFGERVNRKRPIVVCVAHAQAPVWADRLRTLIEKEFNVSEMIETDIGPVVGTHAGPGCVGAVVFQPERGEEDLIAPLD